MRALVVTADPGDAARWDAALAERGHQTERVTPGAAAWRAFGEGQWELVVVIAHRVGDTDARLLLQRIRGASLTTRPYVIAVVPLADARAFQMRLDDGADDVVLAPVEPALMRARLLAAERRGRPAPTGPATRDLVRAVQMTAPTLAAPTPDPAPPRAAVPISVSVGPAIASDRVRVQTAMNELNNAIAATSGSIETAVTALPRDPVGARNELADALDALRDVARLAERMFLAAGGAAASTRADEPAPPRTAARRPIEPIPAPAPSDTPGPTILLAEDDARVRRPLRLALEQCGFRVVEAADGDEALTLHLAHAAEIRLAVLDHHMPRLSGVAAMRELKRRNELLPVILVSGHNEGELVLQPGDHPDAFLRKPFQLVDLARTVRRLLESSVATV